MPVALASSGVLRGGYLLRFCCLTGGFRLARLLGQRGERGVDDVQHVPIVGQFVEFKLVGRFALDEFEATRRVFEVVVAHGDVDILLIFGASVHPCAFSALRVTRRTGDNAEFGEAGEDFVLAPQRVVDGGPLEIQPLGAGDALTLHAVAYDCLLHSVGVTNGDLFNCNIVGSRRNRLGAGRRADFVACGGRAKVYDGHIFNPLSV